MARGTIKIKGPLLRKERERLALTQREMGAKLGISDVRIRAIESKATAAMFPETFRRMAELLKIEIPELRKLIGYNEPANGHPAAQEKAEDDFDVNVEPYSEVKVPEIPLFELPLAAGDWMEVSDLCEVSETQLAHGLFRVRLRGDSMKPLYPDGTIVEFRCIRGDVDGPIEGRDYYVQRSDGYATFKRIEKIDEHAMTLRALNKKKYPKRMIVARQEISRMALAVFKGQVVQ